MTKELVTGWDKCREHSFKLPSLMGSNKTVWFAENRYR